MTNESHGASGILVVLMLYFLLMQACFMNQKLARIASSLADIAATDVTP